MEMFLGSHLLSASPKKMLVGFLLVLVLLLLLLLLLTQAIVYLLWL